MHVNVWKWYLKKKKKEETKSFANKLSSKLSCAQHKKKTKNWTNYLEEENLINNLLHAHKTIYW